MRSMRRRRVVPALVFVMLTSGWALPAPASGLSCAAPEPPYLSIRQMIERATTGLGKYPILVLGRVQRVRDVEGDPDSGETVVRVVVRDSPVGSTAGHVRVQGSHQADGVSSGLVELERGERWALVLQRRDDHTFKAFLTCGPSRQLGPQKMRNLLRLARHV